MLSRLRSFLDQWIISVQNYPVSHILLVIATIAWILFLESDYLTLSEVATTHQGMLSTIYFKTMLASVFALPLTVLRPRNIITSLGAVILGVVFYAALPSNIITDPMYGHTLWIVGSMIVAWAIPSLYIAYQSYRDQDQTWSEFTHWWSSLIQGLIGGAIVWAGISASLASVEFLFDIDLNWRIYQYIGVISMICIGGWIWLINLQQESDSLSYPRWMRIFGQYIFLPLCVIYGLILVSYGIKILATGQWPEGQLVYMVSGYVIFGLLTWFAVLPLENKNTWLSSAYRVLFSSFLVTSGLAIAALVMRVQQYGWTINRGLIAVLIVWIVVGSIGSLIWSKRRWSIGIGSFVLLALIGTYVIPPVVYKTHQSKVSLIHSQSPQTTGQKTELYRSMDYLSKNYGTGWSESILSTEQLTQLSGASTWDFASNVMDSMGLTGYDSYGYYGPAVDYWSFYSEAMGTWNISGYDTITNFQAYRGDTSNYGFVQWNTGSNIIGFSGSAITIDLENHIADFKSLSTNPKQPYSPYYITGDTYQLIITQANSDYNTGTFVDNIAGYLLVK